MFSVNNATDVLTNARDEKREQAYKEISKYVSEGIYDDFISMLKIAKYHDEPVFYEVWHELFKLNDLHEAAVLHDYGTFEREYIKWMSWRDAE